MPYIGRVRPTESTQEIDLYNFDGTGSQTDFTLTSSVPNDKDAVVTKNGVVQHTDAYSISGLTLSFVLAPESGDAIEVRIVVGIISAGYVPLDQTILPNHLAPSTKNTAPTGAVGGFAMGVAPDGWIKCNGATDLSTTVYADLFASVGYTFGGSGGSFGVPDLRGEFMRGLDDGRGVDSGRALGDGSQADDNKSHTHTFDGVPDLGGEWRLTPMIQTGHYYGQDTTDSSGGTETRPRNVAVLYCIKY